MSLLLNNKYKLLVFLIPALLITTLVVLIKSSMYEATLAKYIIVDFLIVIPFCYYLLIRKTNVPKLTVITMGVIGVFIASSIIPVENQGVLPIIKMVLVPALEIIILSFIIYKAIKAYKIHKKQDNTSLDFYDSLVNVCQEVFPAKAGHLAATEFSMIYYSLFNWKKRPLAKNEFTYHKNGTAMSVLLGLLLVVGVEVFITHGLIKNVNPYLSILLALLSAYSFLQIVSIMRSMAKRPIYVDVDKKEIVLRFGLLSKAIIPFNVIDQVEITNKDLPEKTDIKYFSPLGSLSDHNIVLHLNKELEYEFAYGFTKKAEKIALFVDEKHLFATLINENRV